MKILVPLKRVADATQPMTLKQDGSGVDVDASAPIINPFDAIALEQAVRLREAAAGVTEIVVVTIGPGEVDKELRMALAVGADRAIRCEVSEALDPWNVSTVLQRLIEQEIPDLVLLGKQAVDDDANQVGQFLAARLNWPQATFASKVGFMDGRLRVERETDAGIVTVSVDLPALVTCDLRLNEPRYAPLPAILKARRKPLEVVILYDLGVQLAPRIKLHGFQAVHTTRTCAMLGSVDELHAQLIKVMAAHG